MSYTVDILVKSRAVDRYNHKGDVFIEGRPNSEYIIKLNNISSRRVKAVVSVDGFSVINGDIATQDGSGYIIEPYGVCYVDGWRISDTQTRAFVFGDKKKSYSEKIGSETNNIGVIGVSFYAEHRINRIANNYVMPDNYHLNYPSYRRITNWTPPTNTTLISAWGVNNTVSFSAANASQQVEQGLGTGMGVTQNSYATEASFTASASPANTTIIYYDDRRGLEARGIVVNKRYYKPDPFPGLNTFCRQV